MTTLTITLNKDPLAVKVPAPQQANMGQTCDAEDQPLKLYLKYPRARLLGKPQTSVELPANWYRV